jgi:hypothetical protein
MCFWVGGVAISMMATPVSYVLCEFVFFACVALIWGCCVCVVQSTGRVALPADCGGVSQ